MLERQRPLALILWNGGIGFGGVVSFLFADLIIIPILDIYRRYYGAKMSAFLLGTFYLAMLRAMDSKGSGDHHHPESMDG